MDWIVYTLRISCGIPTSQCDGIRRQGLWEIILLKKPHSQQAGEWGFICIYSCSLLLSHHPEMGQSHSRKISSGLPLFSHYSDLFSYFIIYSNAKVIDIKSTIDVMPLNHPETISPTLVFGKIVFQETSPWCQKFWRLLV